MPELHNSEWETLGAAPTTPSTDNWKVYFKSDGLYVIDDSGTEHGPLGTGGGGGGGSSLIYRFTSSNAYPKGPHVEGPDITAIIDLDTYLSGSPLANEQVAGSRRIPASERTLNNVFVIRAKGRFFLDENVPATTVGFFVGFDTNPDGSPNFYGPLGFYLDVSSISPNSECYWSVEITMQVGELQGSPESDDWGYWWEGEMYAWIDSNELLMCRISENQGPIASTIPEIEFVPFCFMNSDHTGNWFSLEFLTIEKLTVTPLV